MLVLLTSLSVLFGASLVAYGITRANSVSWQVAGMPGLPQTLWLSTAVLVVVSAALESALRSIRLNRLQRAQRTLGLAWAFAWTFVGCQLLSWHYMSRGLNLKTTL